ncbi:MAG: hypothetical protein HUU18_10710 [Phycisphaerales bacterium]|nr:hypothetical protein [Phycisphaerales bacterium]
MPRPTRTSLMVSAALAAAAGLPISIFAQDAAPAEQAPASPTSQPAAVAEPVATPAAAPAPAPAPVVAPAAPAQPEGTLRFNFKDAPIDQVLDFFAREAGLPIIFEAPAPQGTITFVSASAYAFEDALSILNLNLARFSVHLRKQDKYLYLASLQDAMRRPSPVASGPGLDAMTPDQIVTLAIPLDNAMAPVVVEQIKPLVSPLGGIMAVPAQNLVIVVEAAAQAKRLREIIVSIDAVRPIDQSFRLFPMKHAQAETVANALKGLMGERVVTTFIDKDGRKTTAQEVNVAGLNLQADTRTNAVIAVGSEARIRTAEELIALLDVPESDASQQMSTYTLAAVSAQEASRRIEQLFSKAEAPKRPTVLALPEASKVAVVGSPAQLAQVVSLLAAMDPEGGEARDAGPERRAVTIRLRHASPQAIEAMAQRLMPQRQTPGVRFAAGPDGKSIVAIGLAGEVAAFEALVEGLDVAPAVDKDVRLVRIAQGDPAEMLARAIDLYARTGKQETDPVATSLDAETRTLTLIGSREAMSAFELILTSAQNAAVIDLGTRTFRVEKVSPGVVGAKLTRLARAMLTPSDGTAYVEPQIEAIEELGTLVVRAQPAQFQVIEGLIRQLDAPDPSQREIRVVRLTTPDAPAMLARAAKLYEERAAGLAPDQAGPVSAEFDERSMSVLLTGHASGLRLYTDIIGQLQQLAPTSRTLRLIELKNAKAGATIAFLRDLVESSQALRSWGGPKPEFEAVEATNAIMVAAEPAQMAVVESLIRGADSQQSAERPPMRIFKLKATDASNLAGLLQQNFDARPAEQRTSRPVSVESDAATNTLIVSAHADVLPEIERIIKELNEQQALDAEGREIRIFPLRVARAEDLAQTIDQMYPEPPMPIDPRTRQPRPDLRPPREIIVRADRATNALIVDAPAKRLAAFEEIVRSLDAAMLADNLELRTYRIERADLNAVAQTLRTLASSGTLGAAAGATPVSVSVEPVSRTLIVSGSPAIFTKVESVLKELDAAPARPATGMKMYALRHAKAERLSALVQRLLATRLRDEQAKGRFVGDATGLLEIASDNASNVLIVSAPEEIQVLADELIKALDTEAAATGRSVVRVLPLAFADAGQTATTLSQTLAGIELPSGGRVTVIAAPGSNALILTGAQADLDKAEELIKPLDVRPVGAETPTIETFALKHADAVVVARLVESVLVQQQETDPRLIQMQLQLARQGRADLFRRPVIKVEASQRTNSLIVSAPKATTELAKSVIEQLDVPAQSSGKSVAAFTPAKGRAPELAAGALRIVNATLPQDRGPVEITPEAGSGSLLVIGTPEQVAEAMRVLAELDDRSVALPGVDVQVVGVTHVDVGAIAGTLQSMLGDRTRWPEELRRAERAGLSVPAPSVAPDAKANRLVISTPSVLSPMARQLVATLDQPAARSNVSVEVFRLEKGKADGAATALRQALAAAAKPGEPTPSVTADAASNTLVVSGSGEQIIRAGELVRKLDEGVTPDGVGVRTIYLKHARAESVAPVLTTVLQRESAADRLPVWMRSEAMIRGEAPPVRVAAERRLNAVIVSGPAAVIEIAEQLASQLDVAPGGPDGDGRRAVRIITLQNADASELARTIEGVLAEDEGGEIAPVIQVDKASNSLIVRASDRQMKTIDEIAGRLDAATLSTSRQMRLVPLDRSRGDAEAMARTLQRFLEQQGGVKVEVLTTEELLRKAQPAPSEQRKSGMITPSGGLMHAGPMHAAWMAVAVACVLPDSDMAQPGVATTSPAGAPPEEEAGVTIAVDRATNSLVLLGSPRMTDRLATLALEMQRQMPAEPANIRVIALPGSVDAQPVADVVRAAIDRIGRSSPQNPGGFTGPMTVMPDPAGAALIVMGNDTDFDVVGRLIASVAQLDSASSVTVKVYPLTSATAARTIAAVRDLFTPEPRGAQARRMRQIDLSLAGADGGVSARIDPSSIRMTPDPGGTSVIVAAPSEAIAIIDRLIETIDQSPVKDRLAIRRYALTNARADELSRTLQSLFDAQRQGPGAQELPQARFVADPRTNSLLVTAGEPQHTDVARLLESADASLEEQGLEMAIIPLQQAAPSAVQRIVEEVLIGRDPGKREKIRVSAQDGSSLFVVRAPKEEIEQVRRIVAEIDTTEPSGLPVRSIKLERADAQQVAGAMQKFFQDRAGASSRTGQRTTNRVAVVGDKRTGTLVIAASDEDYAQVESIVKTFDLPTPSQDLQFKVIPLRHARVTDIGTTIKDVVDEMRWDSQPWWGGQNNQNDSLKVYLEPNERTNSLVVVGRGDVMPLVERVVTALDIPEGERAATVVRSVQVKNADVNAVRTAIQRAYQTPGWRSWRGPDPEAVVAEVDRARRAVILVGRPERVEQAIASITELDGTGPAAGAIEAIALSHAKADRAAQSLRQFFIDRARAQGLDQPGVSVIGSPEGNVLIVSADEANLAVLKDLVAQIDQPAAGQDRRIEVYVLRNALPTDVSGVLRQMFVQPGRSEEQVVITPQPSTSSLIVSAPAGAFEQIEALLKQLDAAPSAEEANIMTLALNAARAREVATALKSALPPSIKVTITPVERSNSLLLTGSPEAIDLVIEQVRKIDTEPVRSGLVYRRIKLHNAESPEVAYTLQEMLRARPRIAGESPAAVDYSRVDNTISVNAPADQVEDIEKIVRELDTPSGEIRLTEFVKLQFAKAETAAAALKVFYGRLATEAASPAARNVTILPDPASNSLVIAADEQQWEGIRALLTKLDTKEYDTSRQLAVIPLIHAEATGVAKALNDGLRAPLEERFRQEQLRAARAARPGEQRRPGDSLPEPTVLVDAEGVPTVSPEIQTNSLVVFAAPRDLERIREIVKQLDVSGFADMPTARVIALHTGKPSAVAQTIRELYLGRTNGVASGPRSVMIIGDDAAGALIVRADDERFAQIKALAETLQQQGEIGRVIPHVVRLKHVPAGRLKPTLLATFTESAKQMGETLAIEVDRGGNALVIACTPRLLEEIKRVIDELDQAEMGANAGPDAPAGIAHSVAIVDIVNNDPAEVKRILEEMGVTRPQPVDRAALVSEPVSISLLSSRRALAVLGSPIDARIIEGVVKAIDAAPADASQQIAYIPLKKASADALVKTLTSMLNPADQAVKSGPAKALAEHVRRLQLSRTGADQSAPVDLTKPIRLIADTEANALIVASSQANIDALRDVVRSMDTLPVGDAVIVRIFVLENASATRAQQVIENLFREGESLRRLPGTRRQGLPPTATGQALAGEIAVVVDDRTNSLIVAGRDEAVALVEVLMKDIDGAAASNWIEPSIIALKHADAVTLAAKLREVLVQGLAATPEAIGLQKQFGRLRILQDGKRADEPGAMLQADLFAPVNGLVITPEESLNALIVVGTPKNTEVVRQLTAMLDVESASAANTVRVYPLRFAAAERVAGVVRDLFTQRQRSQTDDRPEDALSLTTDVRTNSLVVSSSAKSLAILEGLLKTLDGEKANFSVGMHVLPVTGADVRQLAPRVERLMRERITAAAQSGSVRNPLDAFSIEPEPTSNLLILACSDENLLVVKELVAALTADASRLAAGERVELIQLRKARAPEVAQSLATLYVQKENERRGANSVTVNPNERLNALIVSGNEQDMIEIRSIAARLDGAEVAATQQVRWIELKSANAVEVVNLLENVLAGRPLGGNRALGGRAATRLQFIRDVLAGEIGQQAGRRPTEADIDGAIKDQVTLTPDARTNSLWITAPEPVMILIAEMVEDIERSSAGARKIEYFRLKNSDARQMSALLRDTFNLRQQGDALVLVPSARPREDNTLPGADGAGVIEGASVTPVPDERMALSVAVDARTNTLVVSGTEEYLSLVRKLVTELDNIEANERERRVYHLRNAKAKEIQDTLQSYFRGDSDMSRRTLGPNLQGSLIRQLEEEVTVIGDEKSNKLVISTSPRYMETVLNIVKELDSAPPQVQIQVLLAEVTLDSSDTWGMDVSVGPFGGEAYKIGSLAGQAGVATSLGVPNLSVSSADFSLLVRALQAQGKLEVLSNPQVMVNNNQIATINVGENVAIVDGVERYSQGNSSAVVKRENVGIILKVTPSISADGFVRMEVAPEISQLSQKTTQIDANVAAPVITQRKVETVVTVRDGQSVVIGGLIQTTQEQRRTKVPIVGDIPIIGLPFRSWKTSNVKTELLVILTPRVIPGQSGYAEQLVTDVTETSVEKLEDPTRIQDYLEQIRQEIRNRKADEPVPQSSIPVGGPR